MAGILLTASVLLTGAVCAMAAGPPIENVSPSDGAQIPVTPPIVRMDFEFVCPRFQPSGAVLPIEPMSYSVTVATSPELGPDGRLAKAFTVGYNRSTNPTNAAETECRSEVVFGGYRTDGSTFGELAPGTYYWAVTRVNCYEGPCVEMGPIWSFTVAALPTPAPPSPPSQEVVETQQVPTACLRARAAKKRVQQTLKAAQRVMRRRLKRAQQAGSPSARRRDLRIARRSQQRVRRGKVERRRATEQIRQLCS